MEAVRPVGGPYVLNKYTYCVPKRPIPKKDIKETITTDVLVVGAGTSGKAAALSARQAGARVIQIDRHTTFRYSGGHIAAIGTKIQKELGIEIDKEQVCLQLMRYGGNMPNQRLLRLWAEHSGPVLDWVMDMTDREGIQTLMYQWPRPAGYDPKREYYPDFPVAHWQTDGKSRALNHSLSLNTLEKHARQLGVEIRYQMRAMQLIRRGKGRVSGLIAMDRNGDFLQLNALRAVVLCTGDYGNNPGMMKQYCPHGAAAALNNNIYMTRNEDLRTAPEPLNTGDGHQMAMRIGAVMESGLHAPMAHATAGPVGNAPFLRVNAAGRRYENEDVTAQSIANSLVKQPGKIAWQVFDAKWEKQLPGMGVGLGRFPEVNDMIREKMATEAVQADTIEDLAVKMQVPTEAFKETVQRYNDLAKEGKDKDFGKRADRMPPIEQPPFFAGLTKQEFLIVLGGLNTNIRLQPLDADNQVIPGLYLAGNTVGNRFAIDYPVVCPGLSHGMAYVTGRFAGLHAAAEVME
jgi:fumarate reductase flavoprotein subunit